MLKIEGFDTLCLSLSGYSVFSNVDIFPQVSLNFAGGASLVLRPQDYLMQQNFIVSIQALVSFYSFFKGLMSGLHDLRIYR